MPKARALNAMPVLASVRFSSAVDNDEVVYVVVDIGSSYDFSLVAIASDGSEK